MTRFNYVSPWSKDNFVGMELEFVSKYNDNLIAHKLRHLSEYLYLKDDRSIKSEEKYPYAHELCICTPEKLYKDITLQVLSCLDKSKTNTSCGFHVHLDMRNRDIVECYKKLYTNQSILYAMNPSNRYIGRGTSVSGGGFAKKNHHTVLKKFLSKQLIKKYVGLNLCSYNRLKTLEVRIHTGTLNYEKITNWVDILLGIINSDKEYKSGTKNPYIFCNRYGFSKNMADYIKSRILKFNIGGEHITVEE